TANPETYPLSLHDALPISVLGGEERADLVRQPVEIRLGVVEEADGAALQRRRQRRHRHRFLRRHPDGAQDANRCHPFLRATPVRSEEHTSELQSLAYLVCR